MDFIFELLFQIIPGKVWIFILVILLVVGGVYVWRVGGAERARYDAATGDQSKSYIAEVWHKSILGIATSGLNDNDTGIVDVNNLALIYYEDNSDKPIAVDVVVDRDEYDSVKDGDKIKISLNPADAGYVVTPKMTRPGAIWYRIGGGAMIGFAAIILLMLIASLF